MHSFANLLTPAQELKLRALNAWHLALEDLRLRMECPDAYHEELIRQSDEMDRLGIVSWQEWRDLRVEADQAYLLAIAGEDYHRAVRKGSG
ncbi:hypothetical protein DJ564_18790 [Pseudomonas sp. 31-12]|uniref:hypothetical protein n=1 Tax=Pseudomonas sp. 31-12 TaxID=2201356 RepID=UPI000D6D815B|nr:hypothetical protein [Pseudomonas sp. 31-12]AWM92706.1 hypothetical protein DJ564_18790 [Pseudomonas sp. 31-12]